MGKLLELLQNPYEPIAIYHSKDVPEGSGAQASDEHCCIKSLFCPAMFEGRSVCADRRSLLCSGAHSGLAMGGEDGKEMLITFFAQGTEERRGACYFDSEEHCKAHYFERIPAAGDRSGYVVFEPLTKVLTRGIEPEVVVFFVDPMHLSALVTLAGFDRESDDSPVDMRFSLSCEQIFLLPYLEGEKDEPKVIVGMTEFFPRKYVDEDKLSFAVPYCMYKRMDENAEKSCLNRPKWTKALESKNERFALKKKPRLFRKKDTC